MAIDFLFLVLDENIPYEKSYLILLYCLLLFSLKINAQVLIDGNGTKVGDINPVPSLTTPFVSTPNQNLTGNYWPVWIQGPINFQAPPSNSGIILENFENTFLINDGQMWNNSTGNMTNVGSGGTTFQEPLIRGGWANTAWLGTPDFPFWQIFAQRIWTLGGDITSSDMRLKQNILNHPDALSKILRLRPVTYDKIDINENTPNRKREIINAGMKNQHGLIAQEVQEIFPELVAKDGNGYLGVNYQELITILIKAMQEQQTQIDSLKQVLGE